MTSTGSGALQQLEPAVPEEGSDLGVCFFPVFLFRGKEGVLPSTSGAGKGLPVVPHFAERSHAVQGWLQRWWFPAGQGHQHSTAGAEAHHVVTSIAFLSSPCSNLCPAFALCPLPGARPLFWDCLLYF